MSNVEIIPSDVIKSESRMLSLRNPIIKNLLNQSEINNLAFWYLGRLLGKVRIIMPLQQQNKTAQVKKGFLWGGGGRMVVQ